MIYWAHQCWSITLRYYTPAVSTLKEMNLITYISYDIPMIIAIHTYDYDNDKCNSWTISHEPCIFSKAFVYFPQSLKKSPFNILPKWLIRNQHPMKVIPHVISLTYTVLAIVYTKEWDLFVFVISFIQIGDDAYAVLIESIEDSRMGIGRVSFDDAVWFGGDLGLVDVEDLVGGLLSLGKLLFDILHVKFEVVSWLHLEVGLIQCVGLLGFDCFLHSLIQSWFTPLMLSLRFISNLTLILRNQPTINVYFWYCEHGLAHHHRALKTGQILLTYFAVWFWSS